MPTLLLTFLGSIQCAWTPIFKNLENHVNKCALGYVQVMLILLDDIDSALKCNNATSLEIIFTTYQSLIEALTPFIEDKNISDAFCQNLEKSKQSQTELSNGCLNLSTMNEFFIFASNNLNDSMKKCQPAAMLKQSVVHRPLLNLSLL